VDLIKACAWCGRVRLNGWLEADEAIRVLRSYNWPEPPRFSHGICDGCFPVQPRHLRRLLSASHYAAEHVRVRGGSSRMIDPSTTIAVSVAAMLLLMMLLGLGRGEYTPAACPICGTRCSRHDEHCPWHPRERDEG